MRIFLTNSQTDYKCNHTLSMKRALLHIVKNDFQHQAILIT